MACFFRGEREYFKGLYADTMDWDWQPYPVLFLDLNIQSYQGHDTLTNVIKANLEEWEREYDILPRSEDLSVRLNDIICTASTKTGKGVIILVDEYDKPLVNNLHDQELYASFRKDLTALYSNFKSRARYIRMVFLTGVSRFVHLSVLSGLNNLSDISFLDKYSGICGISEKELEANFHIGIEALAKNIKPQQPKSKWN